MIFGWITLSRDFFSCETYRHAELVMKTPQLRSLLPAELEEKLSDWEKRLTIVEKRCRKSLKLIGWPEWHNYEITETRMENDLRPQIWKALIDAGCIRVGQAGNRLCFEGKPFTLAWLTQFCKDIAEQYGLDYEFERM